VVEAKLKSHNVTVMVPKFLKVMCTFIQNHLDTEGIFRVGGACQRINALTVRIILLLDLMKRIYLNLNSFTILTLPEYHERR